MTAGGGSEKTANMTAPYNGILVVDKPADFTSFDVVAKLRGILGQRKLGHGGTLDPMATGVLPIFAGTATKAMDLMPDTDKRYVATVQLGCRTDTGDITGQETETATPCTEVAIRAALPAFLGRQQQVPPMYSAVKVGGKRLYELARQGKEIERAPRDIEIYEIKLLSFDAAEARFVMEVFCSKGTYIRTLAEDLAAAADSCATLYALRRTRSGPFGDNMTRTLDEIQEVRDAGRLESILLPVDSAFTGYESVALDEALARLYLNGVAFDCARTGQFVPQDAVLRVYRGVQFLGLARCDGGTIKKVKQFYFEERDG